MPGSPDRVSRSCEKKPTLHLRTSWVGIIANANSGIGRGRARVKALAQALEAHGIDSEIAWTQDERGELVKRANADGACRCLTAVGGDGTIAGLLNERPCVPITVFPAGTENLFASQFRLKPNPLLAAKTIAEGRIIPIDLGSANDRRFSLMAGFGFDADVITRHHLLRSRQDGQVSSTHRLAYVRSILASSWEYRFPVVAARVLDSDQPEVTYEGAMVLVFNLPRYALGLPVAPQSDLEDGWLDLIVFRNPGPLQMLRYLWMVVRGIHLNKPDVVHRRVRKVEISAIDGVKTPVQLDGDPNGFIDSRETRMIQVLPNALEVVVPSAWPDARGSARFAAAN